MDIGELLAFGVENGASDLHLSAGLPPMIRVDGDIRRINVSPLEQSTVHNLIYDIMNDKQQKDYEEAMECDFSFEIPNSKASSYSNFEDTTIACALFAEVFKVRMS